MTWEINFIIFSEPEVEVWEVFQRCHKCNEFGEGVVNPYNVWPNGVVFAEWCNIPTRELAVYQSRRLTEIFSGVGSVRVNSVRAERKYKACKP